MYTNRVKIIFQILFVSYLAYMIRRLWRHKHTNMAASMKKIMETSNAYNFFISW